MRKQTAALFLAVLMAVTAVTAAAVSIGSTEELVTYQENTLYGSASAAEGLTVSLQYSYQSHPYWFTDHTFADTAQADTAFRFYNFTPNFDTSEANYSGITMSVFGDYRGTSSLADIFRQEMQAGATEYPGLLGAYKELYDATPEGELTNTYLRYADYCEFYPLSGWLELPTGGHHWNSYSHSGYLRSGTETAEAFSAYFKIPVLEDDWVQTIVDKRTGNVAESIDVSESRKGTDYYYMETVGICSENTAYFTFNPRTAKGNAVDISFIPGGYGLYSFTFNDDGTVDYGSLSTLRPLDITHAPVDMVIDGEHGNLHYFTTKDGDWYLTVIDLQTMETLQQVCILEAQEDAWQFYKIQDNCILGIRSGKSIAVWQQNDRGLYDYRYTVALPEEDARNIYINLYDSRFAFDGERLAVISWLRQELQNETGYYYQKCGYHLSVYTAEGLAYRAEFTSSLEPQDESTQNAKKCAVCDMSLTWN